MGSDPVVVEDKPPKKECGEQKNGSEEPGTPGRGIRVAHSNTAFFVYSSLVIHLLLHGSDQHSPLWVGRYGHKPQLKEAKYMPIICREGSITNQNLTGTIL